MNFGSYEGESLLKGEFRDENIRAFFTKPSLYVPDPEGESFAGLMARIDDFLQTEVYPCQNEDRSILLVCHGAVLRGFYMQFGMLKLDDFWKMRQPNCSLNRFELTADGVRLIEENRVFYEVAADRKQGVF